MVGNRRRIRVGLGVRLNCAVLLLIWCAKNDPMTDGTNALFWEIATAVVDYNVDDVTRAQALQCQHSSFGAETLFYAAVWLLQQEAASGAVRRYAGDIVAEMLRSGTAVRTDLPFSFADMLSYVQRHSAIIDPQVADAVGAVCAAMVRDTAAAVALMGALMKPDTVFKDLKSKPAVSVLLGRVVPALAAANDSVLDGKVADDLLEEIGKTSRGLLDRAASWMQSSDSVLWQHPDAVTLLWERLSQAIGSLCLTSAKFNCPFGANAVVADYIADMFERTNPTPEQVSWGLTVFERRLITQESPCPFASVSRVLLSLHHLSGVEALTGFMSLASTLSSKKLHDLILHAQEIRQVAINTFITAPSLQVACDGLGIEEEFRRFKQQPISREAIKSALNSILLMASKPAVHPVAGWTFAAYVNAQHFKNEAEFDALHNAFMRDAEAFVHDGFYGNDTDASQPAASVEWLEDQIHRLGPPTPDEPRTAFGHVTPESPSSAQWNALATMASWIVGQASTAKENVSALVRCIKRCAVYAQHLTDARLEQSLLQLVQALAARVRPSEFPKEQFTLTVLHATRPCDTTDEASDPDVARRRSAAFEYLNDTDKDQLLQKFDAVYARVGVQRMIVGDRMLPNDTDKLLRLLSLVDKPPLCPQASACKRIHVMEHRLQYRHAGLQRAVPFKCREGMSCPLLTDPKHIERYAHEDREECFCADGIKCPLLHDLDHRRVLEHPGFWGAPRVCLLGYACPELGDKEHLKHFAHSGAPLLSATDSPARSREMNPVIAAGVNAGLTQSLTVGTALTTLVAPLPDAAATDFPLALAKPAERVAVPVDSDEFYAIEKGIQGEPARHERGLREQTD
jgi:hypothetical protein